MSILFPFFAIGPAMLAYSFAYLLKSPEQWKEALSIIIVGLFLTIITNTKGVKWIKKNFGSKLGITITLTQIGGNALGIILFFVMYFYLL